MWPFHKHLEIAPRTLRFSRNLGRHEGPSEGEYAIRYNCYNCNKDNRLAVQHGSDALSALKENLCWFCGCNLGNGCALMPYPAAE